MSYSSKLTRLMIFDWLRINLPAVSTLACVVAVLPLLYFNPTISQQTETALVVRNQQLPTTYRAVELITFIELPNGRISQILIPEGFAPPLTGSSIKVKHNKHLLYGDSYSWMK
jgi:hypothetical protein